MSYQINGSYGTMYYVKDMAKASSFYKDILALNPRFESADWSEFDVKGHAICLHPIDQHKHAPNEQGVLILDVKNINEMRADLIKKGVEFISEVSAVHPGAFFTDFRDPSGNIVSLYEDTNRK